MSCLITNFRGHHKSEVAAVNQMAKQLQSNRFKVTYNPQTNAFMLEGSARVLPSFIQEILNKDKYETWVPKILKKTDASGNIMIKIVDRTYNFEREAERSEQAQVEMELNDIYNQIFS